MTFLRYILCREQPPTGTTFHISLVMYSVIYHSCTPLVVYGMLVLLTRLIQYKIKRLDALNGFSQKPRFHTFLMIPTSKFTTKQPANSPVWIGVSTVTQLFQCFLVFRIIIIIVIIPATASNTWLVNFNIHNNNPINTPVNVYDNALQLIYMCSNNAHKLT